MASQAFTKALAKRKQTRSLMKKAKSAERPDFSMPEIEDGNYVARIRGKTGITPNKGIPFVDFKWVIVEGPDKGKGWSQTYYLEGRDLEQEERTWDFLGRALKTLSSREDVETWEVEDLEDIVKEINEELPLCRINIHTWHGAKSEGINCYFNNKVKVEKEEAEEKTEDEKIEVDDYVIYDSGEGDEEYVVTKINERKKTATLKSEENDTIIEAKLDELELSNS